MFRKKTLDPAPTFWIAATALPATPATTFFARLGAALNGVGCGDAVRTAAAPYYERDGSKGGAPGIDPEVYFKMVMVGFFENISGVCESGALAADAWGSGDAQADRAGLRGTVDISATPHERS